MIVKYSVVDGGWSTWRLGQCSKTCGGGTYNYSRVCDDPKPSCGGKICEGPRTMRVYEEKCNDICCPSKIMQHSYTDA